MCSIVWFRQDLRVEDHYPLLMALEEADPILLVYVFEEVKHWKLGSASRWWLELSLTALQKAIEAKGGHLSILSGKTDALFEELIPRFQVRNLYYGACYEPEERLIEKRVETVCNRHDVATHRFHHNILYNPDTLQTKSGTPFQVYTPFWRASQSLGQPQEPMAAPRSLARTLKGPNTAIGKLSLSQTWNLLQIPKSWEPGEAAAHRRLHIFQKKGPKYAFARDFPATEGTSKLSPHLHFGEISPRTVWHAITDSETYHKELMWRDFAKHLLYHFPHTTDQPLRPAFEKFPWDQNPKLLHAWQKGETGYPIVDAGMRELWHTGWMHNRVRMIVGSFLIKDLHLHWLEGARWFWDCLVDADLASNTLGWQWVAGCGADAAPFFRIFHPDLQEKKFDPDGAYVRHWISKPIPKIVDHSVERLKALAAYKKISQ